MKSVLIAGHITMDMIHLTGKEYSSLGGPPVYMGLFLLKMGIRPKILTRFGGDIGDEKINWLLKSGILFVDKPLVKSPTTKFRIKISGEERELEILDICDEIVPSEIPSQSDAVLIAPVAGELTVDRAVQLAKAGRYVYLDPQGFLREAKKGKVVLRRNDMMNRLLPFVNAMKVDLREGYTMTEKSDPGLIAEELLRWGVKEVIITMGRHGAWVYSNDNSYYVRLPLTKALDAVGAGDILGAAYTLRRYDKELYESLIFAVSCSTAYIDRPALEKIPDAPAVEAQFLKIKKYQ